MDTVSVNVSTTRSAAFVAGARESTRDFLDLLVRPLTARPPTPWSWSYPSSSPTRSATHAHPHLNGGTGGFGWPMVNRLARTTSVTRPPSGGKTVRAGSAETGLTREAVPEPTPPRSCSFPKPGPQLSSHTTVQHT
ncbi:hypothetical protein EDE04_7021 [Streptomyces sp. 2132.2]|uniref:ATP-binding protein n=1 Tax=Streptomyces sp. 2132.2 TaxID=2485161 RepID=UPI000FB1F6C0|nr:hypothetical protein EDE04_7021 [Streptomyces sp. 2132.2]